MFKWAEKVLHVLGMDVETPEMEIEMQLGKAIDEETLRARVSGFVIVCDRKVGEAQVFHRGSFLMPSSGEKMGYFMDGLGTYWMDTNEAWNWAKYGRTWQAYEMPRIPKFQPMMHPEG